MASTHGCARRSALRCMTTSAMVCAGCILHPADYLTKFVSAKKLEESVAYLTNSVNRVLPPGVAA
jgi:hypothetical protein